MHLPEQDTLVVDADGREVLVPFVTAIVPTVEVAEGYVRLATSPGCSIPDAADAVETGGGT